MARLITPEAILSYPNLFEPRAVNVGDDPKYSCTLIFPEGTDLSPLKSAAAEALKERWGTKTKALLEAGRLRDPFRTDTELKGYPAGATFINVRSNKKPGVVSIYPDENGRPTVIDDPEKAYPGVIVKASLDAYTYDVSGNRGVTFGLGNVQVIREGERLDGRATAAEEFDADMDAAADLSDLTDEQAEPVTEDDDELSDLIGS